MMFRIGHGYDTHAFEEGKPFKLGGVLIPYDKGMKAHSDGDVIIHAICDALLGAIAQGDIGQHFPDTDKAYHNMDSRQFLSKIKGLVNEKNYKIGNIDVTVLAQAPKLAPYIALMRTVLAQDLAVSENEINIKATTTEKLGFVGRQEGITCYAVVLLQSMDRV